MSWLKVSMLSLCLTRSPAALSAALSAATSAAPGAEPVAETFPEITVVAPRPVEPKDITNANVETFAHSHGKPGKRTGQLGRWDGPLCVSTLGVTANFADYVSTRVQAIAAKVSVPRQASLPSDAPCKPNVIVAFSQEPQKFMDSIAEKNPGLLGFHYIAEISKLKTISRPIQAWTVTATAGFDGSYVVDDVWSPRPPAEMGSRLSTGHTSAIVFALVVVDVSKIGDNTIGPLSDYIAMVTLSQTFLSDGCTSLPSILELFSPCRAQHADSITASDIAYLRGLYQIRMTQTVAMQRSAIENFMIQELKQSQ